MAAWWKNKEDQKLYEAFRRLPTFEFFNVTRPDRESALIAKESFLKNSIPPTFTYTKAKQFNVEAYRNVLQDVQNKILERHANAHIKNLYKQKIEELSIRVDLVEAIQRSDDFTVTELSKKLFGSPEKSAQDIKQQITNLIKDAGNFFQHNTPVTSDKFHKMVTAVLEHYKFHFIRTKRSNGTSVKISHNLKQGFSNIYIPRNRQLSKSRAARLLTHEIEVHALRSSNGFESPYAIIGQGLDRYTQAEEGLALFYQNKLRSKQTHASGLWDSYVVSLAQIHAFPETFNIILNAKTRLEEKKKTPLTPKELNESAWNLCLRTYRGITHTNLPGVGYVRDHVYCSGLSKVQSLIKKEGEEVLKHLFVGRVGFHHLETLKQLDLTQGKTPDMISKQIVHDYMEKTAS